MTIFWYVSRSGTSMNIFPHSATNILPHCAFMCAFYKPTLRKSTENWRENQPILPLWKETRIQCDILIWTERKQIKTSLSLNPALKFCLSFGRRNIQIKAFTAGKEAHPIKPSNTCGYCVWYVAQLRGSASRSHTRRPPTSPRPTTAPRRSRTASNQRPTRLYPNL